MPMKAKNMMYVQQMRHLPAKSLERLKEIIETKIYPKKYGMILHDKDPGEEAQVHLMMSFENARHLTSIAKLLGDKPQYVEAWEGEAANGYAYLCHRTKNAKDKYQYDPDEVIANFDYKAELEKITENVLNAKSKVKAAKILDAYYEGLITKEEVEQKLSGSQYGRNKKAIDAITGKLLERKAEEWRSNMILQGKTVKVFWLYGKTGTGKTRLAKKHAEKYGQEYYISGSSRDPFQHYNGQHTVILDELRSNSIPYEDMLRILDPFGIENQVMAPSRYFDKALACDLIIITAPFSPFDFYMAKVKNKEITCQEIDLFDQLRRRITATIQLDDDHISLMEYDGNNYVKVDGKQKDNPYSEKGQKSFVADPEKEFENIFT